MTMERRELLQRAAALGAGAALAGTGASLFRPEGLAHAATLGKPLNKIRFEFIVKTVASPYWAICLAAGKKAAADLGVTGLAYTGGPSEADIAAEVTLLENAIVKKPDFIICAPTDATALDPALDKAYNSGIPVILIDSNAPAASRNVFLATDNFVAGGNCADALAAAIKAKTGSASGPIGYTTFQSNVGSLTERDNGFLASLKKYPGLKIVAHKNGNGDPSYLTEANVFENALTANSNLVGWFGDNLQCVEGAANAAKSKNVNMKKFSLVGFDSDTNLINYLENGWVDGLLLQDPYMMGYGGVWYGVLAAIGVKMPLVLDTGSIVATPATSKSAAIQGMLDPLGKPGRGLGL